MAQKEIFNPWPLDKSEKKYSEIKVWRFQIYHYPDSVVAPSNQCHEHQDTLLYLHKKYNSEGLLELTSGYDGYHCLYQITKYQYDKLNRLIEKSELKKDSSLRTQWRFKYKDQENQISIREIKAQSQKSFEALFLYDSVGKVVSKSIIYNQSDTLIHKKRIYEDPAKTLLQWEIYDEFQKPDFYVVEKWNPQNQLVYTKFLELDSSFSHGTFYSYDEKGRLILEEERSSKAVVDEQVEYHYQDEELIEVLYYENHSKTKVEIYKGGLLREKRTYLGPSLFAIYKYEYF